MISFVFLERCITFLDFGLGQITLRPTKPNKINPIKDALFLHNTSINNNTLQDCTWRPGNEKIICPDPDIKFILYAGGEKKVVDSYQSDWLRQSPWEPEKEDVFLIHGYAGGDDTLPISVLRDGKC